MKSGYEFKINSIVGVNLVKVNIDYSLKSIEQVNSQAEEIKQIIDGIISKTIKSGMTNYEKELAVHDYLARNIVYYKYKNIEDIPDVKHNAYGTLVDNSGVCDGITKAYQLVLNKLGIKTIFLQGTTDGVAHAWNLVRLDGEYYHTDLTSSITLVSSGKVNTPVHVYFNITDLEILETHTIDRRELLPKARGKEHNYYTREGKEITETDNFNRKLKEIVDNNKNNELLELKITGAYDSAKRLIDELYNLDYNNIKTNGQSKVSYNKALNVYIFPN